MSAIRFPDHGTRLLRPRCALAVSVFAAARCEETPTKGVAAAGAGSGDDPVARLREAGGAYARAPRTPAPEYSLSPYSILASPPDGSPNQERRSARLLFTSNNTIPPIRASAPTTGGI